MIIQADVTGLEVVCAAYLSKDRILYQELNDEVDIHTRNQEAFDLPSRLVAKVFLFRILYGGTEYSFSQDPDFADVSTSIKFWKEVIEKFYDKYRGIAEWHDRLLREVAETGGITMLTGRQYIFDCFKYGEFKLPVTQIKNYPVQGFGADIMSILRVSFCRRFMNGNIDGKLVNTVHDSLVIDCPRASVPKITSLFSDVFHDFNSNFNRVFGIPFDLKLRYELLGGNNMLELEEL